MRNIAKSSGCHKPFDVGASGHHQDLTGSYPVTAARTFQVGGRRFFIRERRRASVARPLLFIIEIPSGSFVSSLYPTGQGVFSADYGGWLYRVFLEPDRITFSRVRRKVR